MYQWGRKDGFPGADGSTITNNLFPTSNASSIQIYGATGNTKQIETILTSAALSNGTTLAYTVKHPLTYIYSNNTALYDWFANSSTFQNHNLWNADTKSDYDPCPAKWQMPSMDIWADFSLSHMPAYGSGIKATNGRLYMEIAWYPVAGHRNHDSGQLSAVGYNGTFWSTDIKDTRAQYLDFDLTEIHNYSYFRANAFPVRCIQE